MHRLWTGRNVKIFRKRWVIRAYFDNERGERVYLPVVPEIDCYWFKGNAEVDAARQEHLHSMIHIRDVKYVVERWSPET